jgi:uncharacterized protein YndB with AHSA1/START domain
MSTQAIDTAVHASTVVDAPIEHAFRLYTEGMGTWWPKEHHILEGELDRMVFEPRTGGHVYDVGTDGSECRWSRVLAYEPPHRFVMSWDINLEWKLETDLERTSEVEVRFTAESDDRTRVDLEHRKLERHGEGWERMRDAVGSPNGWAGGLELFAAAAAEVN